MKPLNHNFKGENNQLILIGKTFGHLGQSVFLNELYNLHDGMPPDVNLLNEKKASKKKTYFSFFSIYMFLSLIITA